MPYSLLGFFRLYYPRSAETGDRNSKEDHGEAKLWGEELIHQLVLTLTTNVYIIFTISVITSKMIILLKMTFELRQYQESRRRLTKFSRKKIKEKFYRKSHQVLLWCLTSGIKKYLFDPTASAEITIHVITKTSSVHARMENFLVN